MAGGFKLHDPPPASEYTHAYNYRNSLTCFFATHWTNDENRHKAYCNHDLNEIWILFSVNISQF